MLTELAKTKQTRLISISYNGAIFF